MGCEIGNERGWRDVVVDVATRTGTACKLHVNRCHRDPSIHRSHNPNPNVARTDGKKGVDADEFRPPRLGDPHQHRRPSSRQSAQNRQRGDGEGEKVDLKRRIGNKELKGASIETAHQK